MSDFQLSIRVENEGYKVLKNSTWDQIMAALKQLDNGKYSEISISDPTTGTELLVGGGRERRYIIGYYAEDGADPYFIHDYSLGDEMFDQVLGGTETPMEEYYSVGYDQMLQAVKYFYEHAKMDPDLTWTLDV